MPTISLQQQSDLNELSEQLHDPLIAVLRDQGALTYVVGGSVRDTLLSRSFHDIDFVVVAGTQALMLESGFTQVGRDFPVFLHPKNSTQFALARVERSLGVGHGDFSFDVGAVVTLDEDLIRRDFTINAMAVGSDTKLIDPYGGYADLQSRTLRHISASFSEDPLRVFRGARFMAQLSAWDFKLDQHTAQVFKQMSLNDTLASLSAERVWAETELALNSVGATEFFNTLAATHCLSPWFIELANPNPAETQLLGTEQSELSSENSALGADSSTGTGTFNLSGVISTEINQIAIKALVLACARSKQTEVRFAALMSAPYLQSQSDQSQSDQLLTLCQRLKVPQSYQRLLLQLHTHFWSLIHLADNDSNKDQATRAAVLLNLLTELGALKNSEAVTTFCGAIIPTAQALDENQNAMPLTNPQGLSHSSKLLQLAVCATQLLRQAADLLIQLNHASLKQQQPEIFTDKTGAQIGQIIEAWRLEKLTNLLRSNLT
jgi:tRNA nucleotidyltransferase (CCA-adding enzyme)